MRNILILFLAVAVLAFGFAATAHAAKPVIKADNTSFDFAQGMYILKGNVTVETNNRVITAGEAKVKVLTLEVWGEGGITLKQDDTYFTGDSVYVNGPQNSATIKGGVTFKRGGVYITADAADFNWQTKQGIFRDNVKIDDNGRQIETDWLSYNVATNTYTMERQQ
ncbi:OstA-like protein [Anaeroselena agilis]|uniref:OstA-like protein n=1 Tax=Anaeroselena agilis TaxID=3063788 RepID=A0ABU3P2Y6_9FIRM|nr:OstA-like protein [Selenomonadales bacterium 4137-cl]